jgi:hypothetical protein
MHLNPGNVLKTKSVIPGIKVHRDTYSPRSESFLRKSDMRPAQLPGSVLWRTLLAAVLEFALS